MYRLLQPSDKAAVLALWQRERGESEEFAANPVARFAGQQNDYVAEEKDAIAAVVLAVPVTLQGRQGSHIDYLDDVRVLDEKVQGEGAYYNQRRRWIAAQFYALSSAVRQLPGAILSGNTDYCDKLLQWCLPPRILLLGLVPLWAVVMTVCAPMGSIKWWVAVLLLLLAMAMALPDEQADARLGHALRRMPVLFLLTLANLFRLRGTKDKFIHTEHTGAGSEAPGNNTGNRP